MPRIARAVSGAVLCLLAASLASADAPYRSIDGTGNNIAHPGWGSAGADLLRLTRVAYEDGFAEMSGSGRPGPRDISNIVCAQPGEIENRRGASSFVWQWGQFIDHDITLTPTHDPLLDPAEARDIPTPPGDPYFAGVPIGFMRSIFDPATSVPGNPRTQVNVLTAFIDASNIYGSDPIRAAALREFDGTGRLRTGKRNLLPFNTDGLENFQPDGADPAGFFLSGDVRANEQSGLTSMHTLFMREHNRLAITIHRMMPGLSDEEIYQMARMIVGAELQVVTYHEFLPVLLGPNALPPYAGYSPAVDPGIATIFSTACYRFGHSALPPRLLRLKKSLSPIPEGNLPLRDAFFNPGRILDEGGIEPLLRGLATQRMQEIDTFVVDDIRNFLFGPPGAGGFDLTTLNMQRGRDHGLADYNTVRIDLGLAPVSGFADISSDPAVQARLEAAYGSVDRIDPWVGGLAEDHVPGAMVGELIFTVVRDQFLRLRDADRFWYENVLPRAMVGMLERQTLADIIRRNTNIDREIGDQVFLAP